MTMENVKAPFNGNCTIGLLNIYSTYLSISQQLIIIFSEVDIMCVAKTLVSLMLMNRFTLKLKWMVSEEIQISGDKCLYGVGFTSQKTVIMCLYQGSKF